MSKKVPANAYLGTFISAGVNAIIHEDVLGLCQLAKVTELLKITITTLLVQNIRLFQCIVSLPG